MQRIVLNEISYFGAGCRSMIADEARRRGYKKAFFVTDADLVRFGVASKCSAEPAFPMKFSPT